MGAPTTTETKRASETRRQQRGGRRRRSGLNDTNTVDASNAQRTRKLPRRLPSFRAFAPSSSSPRDDDAEKPSEGTTTVETKKKKKENYSFVKQTTTKDGIEVWTRDSPTSPVKEIRAFVTYKDVTPEQFWQAVADLNAYAKYVPYVGEHEVLKQRGNTNGEATFYVYGVVTAPVVKNRDYTIKIDSKTLRGERGYESKWTLDVENFGPKPKKGVVRLLANDGGWSVTPIDPKKGVRDAGVRVMYQIVTDPGSNIPGWLIDKVNRASVPDVLRAMRKRALSGESAHILKGTGTGRGGIIGVRTDLDSLVTVALKAARKVQTQLEKAREKLTTTVSVNLFKS